ncbi:hypothetical protein XBFM1_1300004 [Xenorhabdus bovienii str. feltiae Moldova]|uniref:Uncharacterized protein n=1 Tax=Xenorhabdus bovienii str. feltiae Moldova TaxID=1398200 RepID=A0A077NMD6_XENBV|nr:hypothetical protein XBFM1_1300004 [Xenorhabdus bovienii str. feltiae Moldova]
MRQNHKIERLWQSLHKTVTRNHCCQFMWQLIKCVEVFMESASLQQQQKIKKGVYHYYETLFRLTKICIEFILISCV